MSHVTSPDLAHKCLKSKGWILESKSYDGQKLAWILFAIDLNSKVPMDAANVVCTIAYILEDTTTDLILDQIASSTSSKLADLLTAPADALSATKPFLEANSKDQATTTVKLHDVLQKQSD